MPLPTAADFEAAYAGTPPWDIGRPQPEVVRLAEEGMFLGQVLDVGCGTGENALHLAALGRPVVGVDRSPTAVERARAKAAGRGLPVIFRVADALDLGALRHRFETALDCGLFHALDDAQRRPYAESLAAALGPGGLLHVLCFSDREPPGPGPRRVTEEGLRAAFRGIFVPADLRPARFETLEHPGGAQAWLASLRRL